MQNKIQHRISVLDSFRGIAAISVMLYHYTYFFDENIKQLNLPDFLLFSRGHFGVQLFFMISGFVIYMTVSKVNDFKTFLYKRFVRLYPTYWLCLFFTTIFLVLFPLKIFSVSAMQFIVNLTMFQGLFNISNIDGSYWSLLPELMFYILMTFLIFFKKEKKVLMVGYVWTLCILLNQLRPSILEVLLNFRFGSYFLSGMMFYQIYMKKAGWQEHFLIVMLQIVVFIIFKDVETSLFFCLFTGIFYLFVYDKLNFFHSRLLTYLGAISYPLYLVHQSFGQTLILYFIKAEMNHRIAIGLAILSSFIVAILIYEVFEKRILKNLLKRKI